MREFLRKLIGYKGTRWFIGVFIAMVAGIAGIVVGYGLKDGWDSVARWLAGPQARIIYFVLSLYVVLFIIYAILKKKQEDDR